MSHVLFHCSHGTLKTRELDGENEVDVEVTPSLTGETKSMSKSRQHQLTNTAREFQLRNTSADDRHAIDVGKGSQHRRCRFGRCRSALCPAHWHVVSSRVTIASSRHAQRTDIASRHAQRVGVYIVVAEAANVVDA